MLLNDLQIAQESLSPLTLQHLRTSSRWVRFFGVLGLISSAFSIFSSIGFIMKLITYSNDGYFGWILMGIALMIALVVASFYLSFLLFDYGLQTSRFVKTGDYSLLAKSFKRQLTYWRLVGILTTVSLAFYFLYFAVLLYMGIQTGF